MRYRIISAMVTSAALLWTVGSVQAQQATQVPQLDRPTRVQGRPNLNGIWQALNTAYWNLEGHSVEGRDDLWQLLQLARSGGRRYFPSQAQPGDSLRARGIRH